MDNNLDLLRNAKLQSYPLFSLKGYITYAKLLSNYDGDTGDILFIYNGMPMRMKARFNGYDTCEMKPSINDPRRDEKKRRAKEAKKRLWKLCTNMDEEGVEHKTLIKIKCDEFDKYGRLLIIAFPENTTDESFEMSINNQMIKEGHGYQYGGGTKNEEF
jgi:endonuclease YncB( thermonuclease family)